uniref:Aminodeoxychorismate lyase n=1 Tax=Candidatus Kentrum sp. FW TaxID=2126338 RepID=A0A450SC94_9GAMM|nr:MAG: aminodeoxychorismate lyase apoprotein [Candidatus Kentron sp. FW]
MILVNGQATDSISAVDRGFQYGDGVFETMAVTEGVPLCLPEHLDRLTDGCQRLWLPQPAQALLQKEVQAVANNIGRGVLKIMISRGVGGRGYAPTPHASEIHPPATRIVASFDWPDYPANFFEKGIETCLCEIRLGRNSKLAGIKHSNRLEQVLGRAECEEKGIPEGIMLDTDGDIIEGTMSNLFLVQGNKLITPVLSHSGVRGIIRARIIDLAHEIAGINVCVTRLRPSALYHSDGAFFCNSVMGIWPVKKLADHCYSIAPVIRRLQRELIERQIIRV